MVLIETFVLCLFLQVSMSTGVRGIGKDALLRAIEAGEQIPDHLLPVGIHRSSTYKWRAHLCTGGKKFSGPPRDTVREAVEDRKRLCEETGVGFILYGKQSHAKPQNRPPGWTEAANIQFAPDGVSIPRQKPKNFVPKKEERRQRLPSAPIVSPETATDLIASEKRTRTISHPLTLFSEPIPNHQVRELCALSVEIEIDGIAISDRFVWPASEDSSALRVYLFTLLVENGLIPSASRVELLFTLVSEQLESLRPFVFFEDKLSKRQARLSSVDLCDTGPVLETIRWDVFAPDKCAVEFCEFLAAEKSVSSSHWLLWQLLDQVVRHRQNLSLSKLSCVSV